MMTGITNIRLEPPSNVSNVSPPIARAMNRAVRIRASIAYWTITDDHTLGDAASRLFRESESFLCVDIHPPTNLDVMASMSKGAANIFLHLVRIQPSTKPDLRHLTEKGMPKHLLHQKMLLFDYPGKDAELWVGSHNWTQRALVGPNVESSIVISLEQDSTLYIEALRNLEYARDVLCTKMDPSKLEDYKAWQRGEILGDMASVAYIEGLDVDAMEGQVIRLLARI